MWSPVQYGMFDLKDKFQISNTIGGVFIHVGYEFVYMY